MIKLEYDEIGIWWNWNMMKLEYDKIKLEYDKIGKW